MFPAAETLDSTLLYARMAELADAGMAVGPGARVLDAAAGLGQDARALAARGVRVTCAEPSRVMIGLGAYVLGPQASGLLTHARAWAEALPFADRSFDAVLCKGALDHFDDPRACIAELARVARRDGRVVLVVANMESLGQRLGRALERWTGSRERRPGRRHHDVPADHYTRYDARLLREHAAEHLHVESFVGVSLFWGVGRWQRLLAWLGPRRARQGFAWVDCAARWFPSASDVIVVTGRPRAAA
jgi:SAM-dependent methyltransferase